MHKLYAFAYGFSKCRHGALVRGAGEEKVDNAWLFFAAVSDERRVLIDTGCGDKCPQEPEYASQFRNPSELLEQVHLAPSKISDVIVTHMHWDHVGDVGLYDKATVYVQREALEHARSLVSPERPHYQAVRLADVQALEEIERRGRLTILDGDYEVAPGLSVRLSGGHAAGLQYAVVETAEGRFVLASDDAYLYENVETETPPGLCRDPARAAQSLREMKALVPDPKRVIPGHECAVTKLFAKVSDRVFRLG